MKDILIIGSTAMTYAGINQVIPKDLDLVMTYDTYVSWIKSLHKKENVKVLKVVPLKSNKIHVVILNDEKIKNIEIEIAFKGSTAEELLYFPAWHKGTDVFLFESFNLFYASINTLLTLKLSHRYLKNSPHFLKTMRDIHKLRAANAFVEEVEWFKRREAETYDYSHPSLNVNKNEFFKNETYNKYDHDDLHEAIKIGNYPAYKDILSDNAQVKCDKTKWDNLSDYKKLNCALEECYVLALERSLIPNDFKTNPKKAFETALIKVCTSITSGWFREWCWENYDYILENYEDFYLNKFHEALKSGKIKLHQQ